MELGSHLLPSGENSINRTAKPGLWGGNPCSRVWSLSKKIPQWSFLARYRGVCVAALSGGISISGHELEIVSLSIQAHNKTLNKTLNAYVGKTGCMILAHDS